MRFESHSVSAAFVADQNGNYGLSRSVTADEIIQTAKALLGERVLKTDLIQKVEVARDFLITQLSALDYEVFVILFLNNKQRLIACEPMFRGSLTQTSIYPREVVKRALELNAESVILAHNHPSGDMTPSTQDEDITRLLIQALRLVEIRVLDHFVIAGDSAFSFAERGLIMAMTG